MPDNSNVVPSPDGPHRSASALLHHWEQAAKVCGAPEGDFSKPRKYLDYYSNEFAHLRDLPLVIVEVGVFRGQFLETLASFFPNASVIGIDVWLDRVKLSNPRITLVDGDQHKPEELDALFRKWTPAGFDILIDDASHIGSLTRNTYDVAIKHLKAGGRYYIEDWPVGYNPKWPDGGEYRPGTFSTEQPNGFPLRYQSYDLGITGIVKSLVDEVGFHHRLASMSLWAVPDVPWGGVVKLVKA